MVLDLRGDLAAESHEVVDDDADDVKAVGDDPSVGEPLFDKKAIRTAQIDANHLDPVSAFKRGDIGG